MTTMDTSMEDDDCTVEVIKSAKKKKLKQAQLPFQMLSSVDPSSTDSTNIVPNKKRKITSPLVESRSSKIFKSSKKDDLDRSIPQDEEEDAIERNDNKEHTVLSNDDTLKKGSLTKNKKSQQKSGALTKFLKATDKKIVNDNSTNSDNSTHKSKARQDEDTSTEEEKDKVCLNESSELSLDKSKSRVFQADNKEKSVCDKDTESFDFQQLESNVTFSSSDDEIPSESVRSTPNKSKETKKSAISVTPKSDKDAKKKLKSLTPKQLEKRQEIAKKKEEKQKLKMEKQKKQKEEKANRQREREKKQKEKEKKEKMEKEQKKKEKELKELKKQMEIEQKQKDKEAKEEERRKREEAKEEEKRRKEEEKLEAERKKQKAASNFASFFVSKKHEVKQTEEESVVEAKNFMPFEVKADMKIASISRRILSEREKSLLDEKRDTDVQTSELYLEDIKTGRLVSRTSSKTWPLEGKDDDIILLDDDNDDNIIKITHNLEKHRPKLLQFKENRRPPYWGTWRKRSKILNSRRPFAKDKEWFDYEVDSDDEWEEEEPGESLKGSDDEKDEENPEENEYDVDNEFMVPHGYLSDEEAQADEQEKEDMSPQTQKLKLKILGEQFEAERNVKTHKLKPKIIGCIWEGAGNSFSEFVPAHIKEILSLRRAWVRCIPITLPSSVRTTEGDSTANAECKMSQKGPKKTKFPNEALADLIRLLHGNTHGRSFLLREFVTFWNKKNGGQLSKISVLKKIADIAKWIACPEEGPMHLKFCWYVAEDIRKQYMPDDEELSLPNVRWTYILTPSRRSNQLESGDKPEKEERDKDKERKHVPLITQFAKKITQEEMKKQLTKPEGEETSKRSAAKLPDRVTPKPTPLQRPPKRVTLISVGRGEQFPKDVLSKYINIKKQEEASTNNKKTIDDDDDNIILVKDVIKRNKDLKPDTAGSASVNVITIDDD